MAGKRRAGVRESDVKGLKYFDKLAPLLERLHADACARDKAGNRELHYDQYCLLILLYLFNPIVSSLRSLQQASELTKVQKRLGCGRASLGSLAEAASVFDPERLKEIIAELSAELQPLVRDRRLKEIPTLTAVDGTLLTALPIMMQAALLKRQTGKGLVKWRLHTQFEVERFVPTRIDVTPNGGGQHDERAVLATVLRADVTYVTDRGYLKYKLFNQIVAAGSSYVCRAHDDISFQVVEERPLSEEARAAGVIRDVVVRLATDRGPDHRPDHPVRLVFVQTTPHEKASHRKGNTGAGPSDGVLRLATNLLDVPAEIIGLIYQQRWTIEIFFRFFKHLLSCRHLLSHSQRGIEIQTYCAIIACLLISLWTGRKPTLRTYEMICYYFCGWASEEELIAHLNRLPPQKS
jgi:DDE family transposase